MAIDIAALELHLGIVTQHAFDHGRDLGGRAAFELRVDTGRFPLDVPVDHDAAATVADVPFGHEVLIPGTEFLAIGSARRRALTPDLRAPHPKGRVDHAPDRVAQGFPVDIPPARVQQLPVGYTMPSHAQPLEPGIRAEAV